MDAWVPLFAALSSQALTVFTLAYTASDSILRIPVSACVAGFTWVFHRTLPDVFENRLYLALLTTTMWIQCIKTFDDLCLSRISVDAQRRQTHDKQNGRTGHHPPTVEGRKSSQLPTSPRIAWALAMLWNARAIGTPWVVSKVPAWPKTHPGTTVVPSRSHETRRHARAFVISYLVLDVFANLPPPDVAVEMAADRQPLLSRLGDVGAAEAAFRASAVLGFWANTFCVIHLVNSGFGLAHISFGLQPVEMLPPVWGGLSHAYTIRNFWGTTWHQTLRRSLTSVADLAAHSILRLRHGGLIARYVKLMICFSISGLLHRSADLMLGVAPGESRALEYFATTVLVIMFEDLVQHFFRATTGGSKDQRTWRRCVGYVWVCLVMYWMTPSWAYPAARASQPGRDVLVPYSVVRRVARMLG
ncbi:related to TRI7 - trichothecene biosynthesis gene cluster [Cephalotrichum gorgonifer]|uniref:Related to TRI7 - trichothecene biosynthesis gene cluster n=1 Tax=Cephalotrichum gorgonifer TaxID=2041049 RepID=A0AAE8MX12_9PEZI|nr:related to TRI7 - trichothecene biosynthesis gene cluster [Cephalotrichum gorgonifer]